MTRDAWPPLAPGAPPTRVAYEPTYAYARDAFERASEGADRARIGRERCDGPGGAFVAGGARVAPMAPPFARDLAPSGVDRALTFGPSRAGDERGIGTGARMGGTAGAGRVDSSTRATDPRDGATVGDRATATQMSQDMAVFRASAGDGARDRASQGDQRAFAGFDRRSSAIDRIKTYPSGSTPTLEASAPSGLLLASQNLLRTYRSSQDLTTTREDEEMLTRANAALVERVASLESARIEMREDLNGVKRMLSDIMSAQAHLLSALANARSQELAHATVAVENRVEDANDARARRHRERDAARTDSPKSRRTRPQVERSANATSFSADEPVLVDGSDAEVEVSESQLQRVVLRRMLAHQRGRRAPGSSDSE